MTDAHHDGGAIWSRTRIALRMRTAAAAHLP